MMQFFQEVASSHAAELGGGYDALIQRDLFWALSRMNVEITRMPVWNETILIETWPCGVEGLLFRRDFIIFDKDEKMIVKGVSGWLLVAAPTLRPQRPSQLGISLPLNGGRKALDRFPERLNTQTHQVVFRKTVAYNEIDQNLHVNNTRYLDWATDCFQIDHYQDFTLTGFSLEFLAETHWGDEIELRKGSGEVNPDIEAYELSSEILLFKAVLRWENLKK